MKSMFLLDLEIFFGKSVFSTFWENGGWDRESDRELLKPKSLVCPLDVVSAANGGREEKGERKRKEHGVK